LNRCEVTHDVITVRDGTTSDAAVLARFCGHTITNNNHSSVPVIHSTSHSALLEFISDQTHQRQGFAATFQFIKAPHSDGGAEDAVVTQRAPSPVVFSGMGLHPRPSKPSASAFGKSCMASSTVIFVTGTPKQNKVTQTSKT